MAENSDSFEWIWHNGALIERTFLEENIAEAREYGWVRSHWHSEDDHAHCLVCMRAIGAEGETYYRFMGASLCEFCFDTVFKEADPTHRP